MRNITEVYQLFKQIFSILVFYIRIRLRQQMNYREVSCGKLLNLQFVGVVIFIAFNYFVFVFEYMLNRKPAPYIILLVIFHILFILLLISMIKSILGDPGRVPIYWGFFAEQNQNRKRRYCLLCHSFKPERCHHCSTCQRCVLNMDHHCPWISNCVGFGNRKFFMLFLFYIMVTLIFSIASQTPLFIMELTNLFQNKQTLSPHIIIRAIGLIIQIAFFIVISTFFKFHVQLVLSNSTTLDNLERQRNANAGPNIYDVGAYDNFVQVFGTKSYLWPLPIAPSSAQQANGVVWPKNQ